MVWPRPTGFGSNGGIQDGGGGHGLRVEQGIQGDIREERST